MNERQSKGGIARAAALTPEQRSAIAKTAAAARWRDGGGTKLEKAFHRLAEAAKAAEKVSVELQRAIDALGKLAP